MPTWSGILRELGETASSNKRPDFDGVRRKYLHALHLHTERQTILYASGWLQKEDAPAASTSINEEDIHALMEVTAGMSGSELDLILHSPGGSVDAAESIVSYLRSRFSDIRVIIPHLAMSAATMIACAADKIVMGKHSFLGPTDPQFLLTTPLGIRSVPAQAVLDQFEKAKRECADPAKLSAWLPMLEQYGPDLLERSEMALELSKTLVKEWLKTYMFESADDSESLAESVSTWLASHQNFKSHSRHLPRSRLIENGMKVVELEQDQALQDKSLSVFHATNHTFTGTPAVKIVENHQGKAFIKQLSVHPLNVGLEQVPMVPI